MNTTSKDPQTHAIIGAAMEVPRELGFGFVESVFQEALAREFVIRGVLFQEQFPIPIFYKSELLKTSFRADFVCFDNIIVEIKALSEIGGKEESQTLNYLKATHFQRGLLLNFGAPSPQFKRMISTH
ncbi:MAG: GxxExxY protein [Verrucomicrobiales bacterium]|jgi:GxxExxY protein